MPKYTRQIVVFLDILGFSNMLPVFEKEALENDVLGDEGYHESVSLNKLVEIFRSAIRLIKKANCHSYQFSDNISISINYISNDTERPDLFIEILALISMLMHEFVKEGYFLRGGVDVGWFLDAEDVAVGVPLWGAYQLESKIAVNPRTLLSTEFLQTLNDYIEKDKLSDNAAFLSGKYVKTEGESGYLNPFFLVTNFEDKEGKMNYFQTYSRAIGQALAQFKENERIGPKYVWLAGEFNEFIDIYTTEQAYLELDDDQLDYADSEIAFIRSLKLNVHGL